MPYPDEIINALQPKYNLSQSQQLQLRSALLVLEVQQAVEGARFDPANLIIKLEQPAVYVSVLSPIAAKEIVAKPEALVGLREVATSKFKEWVIWEGIKTDLERLNQIPSRQLRDKRQLAIEISAKLIPLITFFSNPILALEYDQLTAIIPRYMNASLGPMQEAARRYFLELFKKMDRQVVNFAFLSKKGGVQLGTTAVITYIEGKSEIEEKKMAEKKDARDVKSSTSSSLLSSASLHSSSSSSSSAKAQQHTITYYVKTHQFGSTSQASSTKKVDPKELFIYRVLEYIGYGPKAHFFFNPLSQGVFFIATQDVAFTTDVGKTKSFTPFENIKEEYEVKPSAEEYEDARKNIICLDILARIFRLTDAMTNPGNYGIVTINSERSKWKLIDFRFPDQAEFYLNEKILQGFTEGNTEFCYAYSEFMKYVLKSKKYAPEKFAIANQVARELLDGRICHDGGGRKTPLLQAIARAHEEVTDYFRRHGRALGVVDLSDFEKYCGAVDRNLQILFTGVEEVHKKYKGEVVSLISSMNVFTTPAKPIHQAEAPKETIPEVIGQYL